MIIPGICPLLDVFVEGAQKEVVNETDVRIFVDIKSCMCFKSSEKVVPILPQSLGKIRPELFDADVMDAPMDMEMKQCSNNRTNCPPRTLLGKP